MDTPNVKETFPLKIEAALGRVARNAALTDIEMENFVAKITRCGIANARVIMRSRGFSAQLGLCRDLTYVKRQTVEEFGPYSGRELDNFKAAAKNFDATVANMRKIMEQRNRLIHAHWEEPNHAGEDKAMLATYRRGKDPSIELYTIDADTMNGMAEAIAKACMQFSEAGRQFLKAFNSLPPSK